MAGKRNGSLTQYKPDLKEAKRIPEPPGGGYSANSILWISTFQFLVAFQNRNEEGSRPGKWRRNHLKFSTTHPGPGKAKSSNLSVIKF